MNDSTHRSQCEWIFVVLALLVFAASLSLANVQVESGLNDDWSYIHTAKDLALTGRVIYNGWSAPMIGFQAYWGALFIKLFGFSFLVTRASAWMLAALVLPVLWNIFRLVGLGRWESLTGLLLFITSPLVLPNVATFMTDMPAFLLFAVSLYCAMKAWGAKSEVSALAGICGAAISGILSGSVRQIYWPAPLCFAGILAIAKVRSFHGRTLIAICLLIITSSGILATFWLSHQPYVSADETLVILQRISWQSLNLESVLEMGGGLLGLAVLSLPITLPFALRSVGQNWWYLFICLGTLLLALTVHFPAEYVLPWLGNTITRYGVLQSGTTSLGEKPQILSPQLTITISTLAMEAAILTAWELLKRSRRLSLTVAAAATKTGLGRFLLLTTPFLFIYIVCLYIRAPIFGLFDRYLIPILFLVIVSLLAMHSQDKQPINQITTCCGLLFALYAIATTHDYFAEARARLNAAQQVTQTGVSRSSIIGGFEYDCWTELELIGHVNNPLIKFPADAYREQDDCSGPDDSLAWWRPYVPAIEARFVVTLSPILGLKPSTAPTQQFQRWLPFGLYPVYVQTTYSKEMLLTCKP